MSRFYDSTAWRKLRRLQLSDQPLCVMCKLAGKVVVATEVDHIVPMSKGGAALDQANLQSLCHNCHSRKTIRDQGKTDKPIKGASATGLPIDPQHPWNRGGS